MPDPIYRAVVERRQVLLKPFRNRSPSVEIEVTVRRLVGPSIRDTATGRSFAVGPEIDEPRAWNEYRLRDPDRRYAVAKRRLGKPELRRYRLHDHAPEDGFLDPTGQPNAVLPALADPPPVERSQHTRLPISPWTAQSPLFDGATIVLAVRFRCAADSSRMCDDLRTHRSDACRL
jgi:hypothetical protein